MAYKSKYSGQQIDRLLDKVNADKGHITVDTDLSSESTNPVQNKAVKTALDKKVEKVDGKGLSTNDYTDEEKEEVAKVAQKANKEGYYPNITAGFSDNLVGRGESVDAHFTYRTSGGTQSIKTGVAHINRIKGNSIVLNQYIHYPDFSQIGTNVTGQWSNARLTTSIKNGILTTSPITGTTDNYIETRVPFYGSRKYMVIVQCRCSNYSSGASGVVRLQCWYDNLSQSKTAEITKPTDWTYLVVTFTATQTDLNGRIRIGHTRQNTNVEWRNPQCYDLTLMFGAGKEPSTIDELKNVLGVLNFNYSDGKMLSQKTTAIKTVGFNQWDEEWEKGYISSTTGQNPSDVAGNNIRSKNYIKCLPNTQYYVKCQSGKSLAIMFYNADKSYITFQQKGNQVFTTPVNCYFMRFFNSGRSSYANDICFNISHTGYRNGEYEEYREYTQSIPTIDLFPDGAKSAGGVFDEVNSKNIVKRVGSVDLGELDWVYTKPFKTSYCFVHTISSASPLYNAVFAKDNSTVANITADKFVASSNDSLSNVYNKDKMINLDNSTSSTKRLIIYDSAYSDATQFKASLSDVYMNYELVDIESTDIEDISLDYPIDDFGTEEAIGDENSAPFRADVVYGLNAVDTIRANRIAMESMMAHINELEVALANSQSNTEEYTI